MVGVVLGGGSAALAYVVTRPSQSFLKLAVVDGASTGLIEGNFTNITDTQNALVRYSNATTYANQTGGSASTFSMHLWTETYYDSIAGAVYLYANVTVVGQGASNLKPGSFQLAVNETGPLIGLNSESVPTGLNLSLNPEQSIALYQDGVGSLSGVFTNTGGSESTFNFGFQEWFHIVWRPWYNHFVGFRGSMTGGFTPDIEVGILLELVNTDGGTWA